MSPPELVARLLLQLAVILLACRAVGALGRRVGQTQVVSEMVAGVMLGPSLLGWLLPDVQAWIFPVGAADAPHPSMTILHALGQLALALYMFLVGLELDVRLLAGRTRGALLVGGAGTLVPLALGGLAALALAGRAPLFEAHVRPWEQAVFLGASMAITAFPMLARILDEKGIARTRMGTLALAAGASGDGLAWCLLAVVLATTLDSWPIAVLVVGGGLSYTAVMLSVGRRWLSWLGARVERAGRLSADAAAVAFAVVVLAAAFTEAIGMHAVFGAFVAGAVMPRGRFAAEMRARLETPVTVFLLPVFFATSGLQTSIALLDTATLWAVAGVVILLSIVAKGAACTLAARAAGEPWREAWGIGVLMNARGLMELVLLNVGLEHGVITPSLFAILVVMAVVTTLMASPLFELAMGPAARRARAGAAGEAKLGGDT